MNRLFFVLLFLFVIAGKANLDSALPSDSGLSADPKGTETQLKQLEILLNTSYLLPSKIKFDHGNLQLNDTQQSSFRNFEMGIRRDPSFGVAIRNPYNIDRYLYFSANYFRIKIDRFSLQDKVPSIGDSFSGREGQADQINLCFGLGGSTGDFDSGGGFGYTILLNKTEILESVRGGLNFNFYVGYKILEQVLIMSELNFNSIEGYQRNFSNGDRLRLQRGNYTTLTLGLSFRVY